MDEEKTYYQKRYADLKARHMCVQCGRKKAIKNQTLCPDCRDSHNYKLMVYYYKDLEGRHQHDRDYSNARYRDLKERGLCVKCGHEEATHGTRCDKCWWREKRRRIQKRGGVGGLY